MKRLKKIIFTFLLLAIAAIFLIMKFSKPQQWLITFDGIGPIHIGMTVEKSSTPLHYLIKTKNKTYEVVGKEPYEKLMKNTCTYVSFDKSNPEKKLVSFMLNQGTIVRMDIVDPMLATSKGIKVGDTEQKVKDVYKNEPLKIQSDKYSQDGRALNMLYFSPDKKRLIVFDTNGQTVINIRVGQSEEAQLVEKCL